ncbi:tripartite tricarboxylate transporter TctB family protein [Kiloniella antarctica]|uniref:Tripartite tricarboxylate transporter TctB family protein n=1 Tax=Kiloniella antarctica TaxID=1550907 RepID=A0ABW5BQ90_9PROT
MVRAKQDVIVAALLLLFCGVMISASYDIRDLGYPGLKPETWPRFLLILLSALSALYFIRSIKESSTTKVLEKDEPQNNKPFIQKYWFKYKNAFWCFLFFSIFLSSLDYLGMLFGGMLFVFALLTALGERTVKNLILHIIIAVISVGAMWLLFTYSLRVNLPEGALLSIW